MGNSILEYPVINIIHDTRRLEKYHPLIEELEKQRCEYNIWEAEVLTHSVVDSIALSHKKIVQDAKDKGLVEVCIAEDDLQFTSEKSFEWFLKNKPPVYDIYSACNYLPFVRDENRHGAFRVKEIVGFHLYFIHSSYYNTFLNTPLNNHIDTAQKSELMYVCYPFAAVQRAGFSANNMAVVNYNRELKDNDIYK